jgi:DNA-binding SARP family transcriptional activator
MQAVADVLDFRILGPLEVMRDGAPVALGTPKMRDLLALLVLDAPTPVTADVITEQLWGDDPPSDVSGSLQSYVSRLRSSFAGARDVLVTRGSAYFLDIGPDRCDASRFEDATRLARSLLHEGRHADASSAFREALAMWRGRALQDVGGTRAEAEAMRLNELRLAALEDRLEADLAVASPAELVAELEVLALQHPLRERFWAQRMRALYRAGRQADALAAYDELRSRLSDELGLDPSEELRLLHQAILRQDASLAAGAEPPAPAGAARLQIHVRGPETAMDLELPGKLVTIGRAPGNDVVLGDPLVSGTHAALERVGHAWSIRDLGSRNGTWVNGRRLVGERVLGPADEVRFGDTVLLCRVTTPASTPTIGVVRAPELAALERQVLVELCRPLLEPGSGGEPASAGAIATSLSAAPSTVTKTLRALCEKFGVPDDAFDLLGAQALESGAVTPSDLR